MQSVGIMFALLRIHACGGLLPSPNCYFSAQMVTHPSLQDFGRVRQGPHSGNLAEESHKSPGNSSIFSLVVHKTLQIPASVCSRIFSGPQRPWKFQHTQYRGSQAFRNSSIFSKVVHKHPRNSSIFCLVVHRKEIQIRNYNYNYIKIVAELFSAKNYNCSTRIIYVIISAPMIFL